MHASRNRSLRSFLILFFLIGTAGASFAFVVPESPSDGWYKDGDAAWRAARDSGRPLLLVFTSERCYYCHKLRRNTLSSKEVMEEINRSYVATVVRASDRPGLVRKAGVRAFPTTIIVGPDGQVRDRLVGYTGPQQFRRRMSLAAGS